MDVRVVQRRGALSIKCQAAYKNATSAATAAETLNGAELDGSKLIVSLHEPKQRQSSAAKSTEAEQEEDKQKSQPADQQANDAAPQPASNAAATGSTKKKSIRKPKSKPARGEPSETMLYVSHLAYSVNNDTLMELFSPYNVKSANVVYNRFRSSKSRGFAFVDFHTHEDQQRAMAEKNGLELMGRVLNVTVALQEAQPQQEAPTESAEAAEPTADAA